MTRSPRSGAPPGAPAEPAAYEAWYATPRGAWIARAETRLLLRLLRPRPGARLLDAGCGTGHFSRRLAARGLRVTGLDPDPAALARARDRGGGINYVRGDAGHLPFADAAFDHAVAVLSLCFVDDPAGALAELVRVSRGAVVLGLLHRRSLLHRAKAGRGGYRGARWDAPGDVRRWAAEWAPGLRLTFRTAVFLPAGGPAARLAEPMLPARLPWGGFLAVRVERPRP
jgi:SAM-dependent methyltransferase